MSLFDRSIHFWPFDGWSPRNDSSVIAEVYPSIWRQLYPDEGRTADQQDAFVVCRWLQETDRTADLKRFFNPRLDPKEQ
jgi:hypothetical protein